MRLLKCTARLVFENFGWKLLALAAAIAIWALVASEPELATFATVRLQYKNLPDDLEISSEPIGSISLELRGPSGELRGVGDGAMQPAVILDMFGVHPGEHTFPIGEGNVKLARSVRLVRAVPSEVRFRFERRAMRDIAVIPRFTGEGAHGYEIAHWDVQPPKLQLVGPASRVDRIQSVVTDPVDVSNVVGSSEFRVNAYVEDAYVRFRGSPQVLVVVTMKKK
jgi:hypothetical protein